MSSKDYVCSECGKSFTRNYGLKRHFDSVHLKKETYQCTLCDYKTSRKDRLNTHIKEVHQKIRNHICEECGLKFSQIASLKRHIISVHKREERFICSKCDARFKREDSLKRHLQVVHENTRPHICKECGATFKLRDNLKQHFISIHKNQRKYVCDECGFAFKLSQHLNDHVRVVHRDVRPYSCEECDSAFPHARGLKLHVIAMHTDELPYVCTKCGRGFADPSHLYRHEQAEACWFTTTTAYKWEELCKEIAEILLEGKNWEWKPTIETPELEEQTRVQPEIVIYNDDGTMDFIDAKRSTYAIYKEKDLVVYPKVARRVEFWCLYGKTEGMFEKEGVEGKSSEEIIKELKNSRTGNNGKSIDKLIMKIHLLKKGLDYENQKLISDFKNHQFPYNLQA